MSHQDNFNRVRGDGRDEDISKDAHTIKQSTYIADPIKYAVGLPLNHNLFLAELQKDTIETKDSGGIIRRRPQIELAWKL